MKLLRRTAMLAAAGVLATTPSSASAQAWTTWTSMTPGAFNGTLFGSAVAFSGGDIGGNLSNAGIDYFAPSGPYTQNGHTSPDAGGNVGFIQFNGPTSGAFQFGAPLSDLFLAFISVGQHGVGVSYAFDRPFIVVSDNTSQCAYWGCGNYTISGNTITGYEFSGTIQFSGPVDELSFTTDSPEYWHGITVGSDAAAPSLSSVPEPTTLMLIATGLIGVAGVATYKRKTAVD